jgi:hypothetical protein
VVWIIESIEIKFLVVVVQAPNWFAGIVSPLDGSDLGGKSFQKRGMGSFEISGSRRSSILEIIRFGIVKMRYALSTFKNLAVSKTDAL